MEQGENQAKRGPNGEGEGQYHRLLALSRVSAALSSLGDLDAILRIALKDVLDVMEGTIGGILLLDEKTQTLSFLLYGLGLSAAGRVVISWPQIGLALGVAAVMLGLAGFLARFLSKERIVTTIT